MTTDEFIKKHDAKIKEIIKTNKPLAIAVKSIMSVQAKRIFLQGLNASEGIIGEYSDKEIYVSPNANKGLPAFPLKGKNGDTKFANGSSHKAGYFKNYLAFKTAIGRNQRIKTVDLFLTGSLLRNWANAEALTGAQAKKINSNNYIVSLKEENMVKASRYGNVFRLSKKEKDTFLKVIQFELSKALQ